MALVMDTYLNFVTERHAIWEKRQRGEPQPWTTDPLLATRKFCNVYRVLDAGSQFLLSELLHATDDRLTQLMRCVLYRYTNRPEPWRAFRSEFGRYPEIEDLRSGTLLGFWEEYPGPLFSNAYRLFVGQENKGRTRLEWAVNTTRDAFGDLEEVARPFYATPDPVERLRVLQKIPRCAQFMSMQIMTDAGYIDPEYDENSYVVPGPGALRGAELVEPGADPVEVITRLYNHWKADGTVTLPSGRPPSLMDVQNTLCEFSKYVKWSPGSRAYRPANPGPQPAPTLPRHW